MEGAPEAQKPEWDEARGQELLSAFKELTGCPADWTLTEWSQLSAEEKQQIVPGNYEA